MAINPPSLPPDQAWTPLDPARWDADCARHLLRRTAFSAPQTEVDRALQQGLPATLQDSLGTLRPMPQPAALADYLAKSPAMRAGMLAAQKAGTLKMGDKFDYFFGDVRRDAYRKSMQDWLAFARAPENSAQENFVMFLCGVLVVAINKINSPEWLFGYQAFIRASLRNPYPEITKALPFTLAMAYYLDLFSNYRNGPNENYARELLELFTLGEGQYTETDVKEAARAFTGFYNDDGFSRFDPARWDSGSKTIFGQTGPWGADDVADLIFTQPAARTHLPARFLSYYLSDDSLPAPYLESLGALWQQHGWRMDALASLVFSSKLFYEPSVRGNLVKSPVRFYLGMCQDLALDIYPFPPDQKLLMLAAAGQDPFDPPTVRGWLGGRTWLNPSTWLARAQLVEDAFTPRADPPSDPDEAAWLNAARARGLANFFVLPDHFQDLASLSPDAAADLLVDRFLPGLDTAVYRASIADYLKNSAGPRNELLNDSAKSLLLSPLYQLC
jgi:uncharacterized protein (DUF1800 family)